MIERTTRWSTFILLERCRRLLDFRSSIRSNIRSNIRSSIRSSNDSANNNNNNNNSDRVNNNNNNNAEVRGPPRLDAIVVENRYHQRCSFCLAIVSCAKVRKIRSIGH